MMVFDYVGDEEAMVNAQVGHHPLARTTETSLKRRRGTLSCLSARPPDLADAAITRPRVVAVFLSTVPFVYSKRAAATRSLVSRYGQSIVLWPLWSYQPSNHPLSLVTLKSKVRVRILRILILVKYGGVVRDR